MTGYGSEVIEQPFPHVQVLQKPSIAKRCRSCLSPILWKSRSLEPGRRRDGNGQHTLP